MVSKQKILIVDDDENIADLISLYLTKECYETKMVYNGEDALTEVEQFNPNLIVLDLMLLPIVERENAKRVPEKFRLIADALGFDTESRSDAACSNYVIERIIELSEEVGIPKSLKELGVENPDLELLAENSLKDACAPGNPYMPTKEETISMFKEIVEPSSVTVTIVETEWITRD